MIETIIAAFIAANLPYYITQYYVTCGEAEYEGEMNVGKDISLEYVSHLELQLENTDKCLLIMSLKNK